MTIIIRRRPSRALTVFEPFYRRLRAIDEAEELAREAWSSWSPYVSRVSLRPYVDMHEENGELVVKTELAGFKKEDLDISLEGDVLTIKAERKPEKGVQDTIQYFGQYLHSVSLPFRVDADKVSATFDNGLLEIKFPKAEEAKPKKIEVKAQLAEGAKKKRPRKRKSTAS